MDPFSVLGLQPQFSIDLSELADRQRQLSLTLHPDRYGGRPASERRAALGRAIEVNEAYRLLKDPVKRAAALFDLWQLAYPEGEEPAADAEFLMDMMEGRQELREAGAKQDHSRLQSLEKAARARQAETVRRLGASFANLAELRGGAESGPLVEQERTRGHGLLAELRYWRRYLDEAQALVDEWELS